MLYDHLSHYSVLSSVWALSIMWEILMCRADNSCDGEGYFKSRAVEDRLYLPPNVDTFYKARIHMLIPHRFSSPRSTIVFVLLQRPFSRRQLLTSKLVRIPVTFSLHKSKQLSNFYLSLLFPISAFSRARMWCLASFWVLPVYFGPSSLRPSPHCPTWGLQVFLKALVIAVCRIRRSCFQFQHDTPLPNPPTSPCPSPTHIFIHTAAR